MSIQNTTCLDYLNKKSIYDDLDNNFEKTNDCQEIDFSYMNIFSLPKNIKKLGNLKCLDCSGNLIRSLPTDIKYLVNLEILNCSINLMGSLPYEIGMLIKLKKLNCSSNELDHLPKIIGNLSCLEHFSCAGNRLLNLPLEIGNLKKLKIFACSTNKLVLLPNEIGLLNSLEQFYCDNNRLSSLPKEFGELINLKICYLRQNMLVTLPSEFGKLKNLVNFLYSENHFVLNGLPPNVKRMILQIEKINQNEIFSDEFHIINQSIQLKIFDVLNDPRPNLDEPLEYDFMINIKNSSISESTKNLLVQYANSIEVHSVLNITFRELFECVWDRIMKHEKKQILFQNLDDEMRNLKCQCMSGKIIRLMKCLDS